MGLGYRGGGAGGQQGTYRGMVDVGWSVVLDSEWRMVVTKVMGDSAYR